MVAGHLQEKNGIYYVVLTYKTYDGKRKTKWQSTGLPIKGNKRRAEAMMRELQDDFEPPVDPNGPPSKAMLFADYLVQWLEIASAPCRLYRFSGNGCWPCRRNRKKTASCAVGATTKNTQTISA